MNRTETGKLLAVIKAEYQHKFLIDNMTEGVWMELLNAEPPIPFEAAKAAVIEWMKHNDWPPTVKNLRDIVAEKVLGIPSANEAWTHLQRWLKGCYPGIPNSQPALPDLIAQACRDLGGTTMIRNAERPDKMRERFVERYDRLRREQMQVADVAGSWAALGSGSVTALPRKVG